MAFLCLCVSLGCTGVLRHSAVHAPRVQWLTRLPHMLARSFLSDMEQLVLAEAQTSKQRPWVSSPTKTSETTTLLYYARCRGAVGRRPM